jgi:hypothetical protein
MQLHRLALKILRFAPLAALTFVTIPAAQAQVMTVSGRY